MAKRVYFVVFARYFLAIDKIMLLSKILSRDTFHLNNLTIS